MASNRHLGRIIALQTLYEYDFRRGCDDTNAELDDILTRNLDRYDKTVDDKDFVRQLVNGVVNEAVKIDTLLQPIAPDWPINQIAGVDREILHIAVYELQHFRKLVPPKVAINEAVELAKSFGSESSSKFINGVLGTVYRQMEDEDERKDN